MVDTQWAFPSARGVVNLPEAVLFKISQTLKTLKDQCQRNILLWYVAAVPALSLQHPDFKMDC